MPRKPRVHVPGGVYHVLLRGNWGQKIFHTNDDFLFFLSLIQEGIEKFDHKIHSYCCMTNHVHLAVQVEQIPLSKIMQTLAFRFARHVNWRNRQVGHLFQGRYKAILVNRESYLLELIRYIHLNPVRAGIVEIPDDYRWSSHRAYLGQARFPWLTTGWILDQFHPQPSQAKRLFTQFVSETGRKPVRFLSELQPEKKEKDLIPEIGLNEIIEFVCELYHLSECQLCSSMRSRKAGEARAVIGILVKKSGCVSLRMLARRLKKDFSSFCRGVKRIEKVEHLEFVHGQTVNGLLRKIEMLKPSPGA